MMSDFSRVFLDTAPIIYFLNLNSSFRFKAEQILSTMIARDCDIVTSAITCAEYLVHPYRSNNFLAVNAFWSFLEDSNVHIANIDTATAEKAAKIRAEYPGFKAFDSMQLACACNSGCDLFLTNDKQLKQFTGIPCVTVEEWEFLD